MHTFYNMASIGVLAALLSSAALADNAPLNGFIVPSQPNTYVSGGVNSSPHYNVLTLDVPLATQMGGLGNTTGDIAGLNYGGVALLGNLCLLNASCTWAGSQAFPSITLSTALPVGSGGLGNSTGDLSGLSVTPEGGVPVPVNALLAANNIPSGPTVCFVGDSITMLSGGYNQYSFTASGGTGPYTSSISGLPGNLGATWASPTWRFTPVTVAVGSYPIVITVTDSASHTSTFSYTLTVATDYDLTFAPTGSTGILSFSLSNEIYSLMDWGPAFWLNFLSYGSIQTPRTANFGHPGDTTSSVLARISTITAAAPSCSAYAVMIGVNDSLGISALEANLTSIWNALLATGRPVFAETILPRQLTSANAAARNQIYGVNRWIRTQNGAHPNLRVVDAARYYADPFAADGGPISIYRQVLASGGTGTYTYSASGLPSGVTLSTTGIFASTATSDSTQTITVTANDSASHTGTQTFVLSVNHLLPQPLSLGITNGGATGTLPIKIIYDCSFDGLHPTACGSFAAFSPLAQAIDQLFPSASYDIPNSLETYDATYNTRGNQLPNGMMSFQAGTGATSGRASGSVPDGWSLSTYDNGCSPCTFTATGSASTLSDGTPAEQIVIAGTAMGGFQTQVGLNTSLFSIIGNFSAGDIIYGSCRIEVSGGATHVSVPTISAIFFSNGTTYTLQSGAQVINGLEDGAVGPNVAYSGKLQTPLPGVPLPSTLTGYVSFGVDAYITNAPSAIPVAATFKVGGCSLNKV